MEDRKPQYQCLGYYYPAEAIKEIPEQLWLKLPSWSDMFRFIANWHSSADDKFDNQILKQWIEKYNLREEELQILADVMVKINPNFLFHYEKHHKYDERVPKGSPHSPESVYREMDKRYAYVVYRLGKHDYMPYRWFNGRNFSLAYRKNNYNTKTKTYHTDFETWETRCKEDPVWTVPEIYNREIAKHWNRRRREACKKAGVAQKQVEERKKERAVKKTDFRVKAAAQVSKLEDELEAYKKALQDETFTREQISKLYDELTELTSINKVLRNLYKL